LDVRPNHEIIIKGKYDKLFSILYKVSPNLHKNILSLINKEIITSRIVSKTKSRKKKYMILKYLILRNLLLTVYWYIIVTVGNQ